MITTIQWNCGELYIELPKEILDKANLKEDDVVEFIDNNDGSFSIRKSIPKITPTVVFV